MYNTDKLDALERAQNEAIEAERNFQPTGDINADRIQIRTLWAATNKACNAYQAALLEAMGG